MSEEYRKYICKVCGLIYDEAEGDPDSGLAPGTRFEDIPDDWYCPLCLVSKADFIPLEEMAHATPDDDTQATHKVSNHSDVMIIGSGYAGWQVAEAVRKQLPDAEITLITADDGIVYPKPSLSMALRQERTAEDLKEYSAAQKSLELNIGVKTLTRVMSVSEKYKKVLTTRGIFYYDKLIIATGAKALKPQVEGVGHEMITLNDLPSYRKFRQTIEEIEHITVIGGGLIGTEMAEDLVATGKKVTLLVRENQLMPGMLPEVIASDLANKIRSEGVDIRFQQMATAMHSQNGAYQLTLDNGEQITTGLVLSAIGIAPNTELATKLNLEVNKGIKINEYCQTSNPDVYAIGDCAESSAGVQAFLEPIRRQANTIAAHLKGETDITFDAVSPLIKTKTTTLSIMLSLPLGAQETEWQAETDLGENHKLVYKDQKDQLRGFALSGDLVNEANQLYKQITSSAA